MRSLPFVAALLVSPLSFATPKVGDYANYNTTMIGKENTIVADQTLELVAYDQKKKTYTERLTMSVPGEVPTVTNTERPAADYRTDAEITDLINHCQERGGTPQRLLVPAGTFNTCAVAYTTDDAYGINWVALVPFGSARLVTTLKDGGTTFISDLRTYH